MSEEISNLNRWLRDQLTEVHTCLPGQVVSFDAATQTCSVVPTLKRLFYGDDDATEIPVIEDVPIVFPGSGNFWITFDVKPDSYVLLVFAERSIAKWMDLGGIVDPEAAHKFDYSDAVAIPGLLPEPVKLSGGVQSDSIEIRDASRNTYLKLEDGAIEINGDSDFAVAFNDLKTGFDDLRTEVNAFLGKYNTHTHAGAGPSPLLAVPAESATTATATIDAAKVSTVKVP
jgi:hypothetical protein